MHDQGRAVVGGEVLSLDFAAWAANAPTIEQSIEIPMGDGCEPVTCPEPTPTQAPGLTVEQVVNGSEIDLVLSWSPVAGAAGHHVLQSTSAALDAGVDLLARTTAETTHTIADGVHSTPALTFFQVRATNSCNQEGP